MAHEEKPKTVIICGPTGIGKTSVAITLSQKFNGEVINADSMQVYRYMDIGSAKPTKEEQIAAPHHLIDIVDPDEPFDAGKFSELALQKIKALHRKNIFPFVAGGTGLYIKALAQGLFRSRPADPDILKTLNDELEQKGPQPLHERLTEKDPAAAQKIHPNDGFRIIRALEIFEATGKPISTFHQDHHFSDRPLNAIKIGLHMDRQILYDRINQRVDIMIEEGIVEEVKSLLEKGYSIDLKPMNALGYRHIADHLIRQTPWEEALYLFKRDTRRYAKRQLTWFRKDTEIKWFHPSDIEAMTSLVEDFINSDS